MTTTTELLPNYLDVTKSAIASFLARYREPTLTAYTQDLKAYLGWCQQYDLEVLRVTRDRRVALTCDRIGPHLRR